MSRETIIDKELDEELIRVTLFIQSVYETRFTRTEQSYIEKWISKLAKISYNHDWKRRRNEYVCLLAEHVDRGFLSPPFNQIPPEGQLPPLQISNKTKTTNPQLKSMLKNTDQIARLIEEQLGTVDHDEFENFDLSPPETEVNDIGRKLNVNNTYEITPSKTNRYKSFRDSLQGSKPETAQMSQRLGQTIKDSQDDE